MDILFHSLLAHPPLGLCEFPISHSCHSCLPHWRDQRVIKLLPALWSHNALSLRLSQTLFTPSKQSVLLALVDSPHKRTSKVEFLCFLCTRAEQLVQSVELPVIWDMMILMWCYCSVLKFGPYHTLTHWGWVTHIYVSKLTTIGSDNGLSPGQRQAIIWIEAEILLICPPGNNLQWNLNRRFIHFHSRKCIWKCCLVHDSHFVSASMC